MSSANPDYCFLWFQTGSAMCMPRSEWSGWAQAAAALLAIVAGFAGLFFQAWNQRRTEVERLVAEDMRRMGILAGAVVTMRVRLEQNPDRDLRLRQSEWGAVDEAVALIRTVPLLNIPNWRVAFAINQSVDSFKGLNVEANFIGKGYPSDAWFDNGHKLLCDTINYLKEAERQIGAFAFERNVENPVTAIQAWSVGELGAIKPK